MEPAGPDATRQQWVDRCADAWYELLQERALSIGIVDIAVEVNGWFIDSELLFGDRADIGISLDARSGELRCCELLDDGTERWLDDLDAPAVLLPDGSSQAAPDALAHAMLDAVLVARRATGFRRDSR